MIERKWAVRRKAIPQEDAHLKWDLAYQCLLKWAQTKQVIQAQQDQEVHDESSHLCPRINAGAS